MSTYRPERLVAALCEDGWNVVELFSGATVDGPFASAELAEQAAVAAVQRAREQRKAERAR